jgi:hypothetical protein
MERLTSPEGALGLAIVALLVVLGHRLARPARAADWLAVGAYAGALVAIYLGARAGPADAAGAQAGVALRLAGALALLAGVLVAGSGVRARLRAATPRTGLAPVPPGERARTHAGLALVLAGQLLRAPTRLGAVAALVAAGALAWAGWRAHVRPIH